MAIEHQETILQSLKEHLKAEQISVNETIKELHGKDESYHKMALPDIVVFPETTEQVSEVMKISTQFQIPVVPFGLGSSLEGHIIPQSGGITIDFSLMNKVLNVYEEDFLVTV